MPRTKKRRAPARRGGHVLAFEWRAWIAENLLRGVPRSDIAQTLRAHGVPVREIERRVREISESPAFAGAQSIARDARRFGQVLALERAVARAAAAPGAIERRDRVSARELFDRYYASSTPVVLTDVARRWRACARWTPQYLKKRFGRAEIEITDNRGADPDYDMHHERHRKSTTIAELVDRIERAGETNEFYAVANNRNLARPALGALLRDIDPDRALLDRKRLATATQLWLGPAGTVTPLHHDTSGILFCQIHGRKRFLLAAPSEVALLRGARAMYAAPGVDPERIDTKKHPWLRDVAFKETVLEPGDSLFLPVGWWHHVRALDVSISLAFNGFVRPNRFDWYRPGNA